MKAALILLVIGANSPINMTAVEPTGSLYTIQLKSDPVKENVFQLRDFYAEKRIPVYIVESEVKGQTYYRLRAGLFQKIEQAKTYSEYHHFKDIWITTADGESVNQSEVISRCLTLELFTSTYSLYTGKETPFFGIYQNQYDFGGMRKPSTLTIYTEYQSFFLKDITGYRENQKGIRYGKSHYLYFMGEDADKVSAYRKISHLTGIDLSIVESHIALFSDGYEAYFTSLEELDFKTGKVTSHSSIGFDYYDGVEEIKRPHLYHFARSSVTGNAAQVTPDTMKQKAIVINGKNMDIYINYAGENENGAISDSLLAVFYDIKE